MSGGESYAVKEEEDIIIVVNIKITHLWSRGVSQVISDLCSAVFNVRVSKTFDVYFSGKPNENVFEWLEYHEDAARVDNISHVLELGLFWHPPRRGKGDHRFWKAWRAWGRATKSL